MTVKDTSRDFFTEEKMLDESTNKQLNSKNRSNLDALDRPMSEVVC